MELKKLKSSVTTFVKKYRYVALILAVGLLLMCIPNKSSNQKANEVNQEIDTAVTESPSLDVLLGQILSKIDGAGSVQVLLTLERGEETVYQTDNHTSAANDTSTTQIDTVIISGTDRDQNGLIRQINPPTYQGVIVVCQGADSPAVRLAIVDAVSKVTGLGADRISVLKMK